MYTINPKKELDKEHDWSNTMSPKINFEKRPLYIF
jgi:hypothetical protein